MGQSVLYSYLPWSFVLALPVRGCDARCVSCRIVEVVIVNEQALETHRVHMLPLDAFAYIGPSP